MRLNLHQYSFVKYFKYFFTHENLQRIYENTVAYDQQTVLQLCFNQIYLFHLDIKSGKH